MKKLINLIKSKFLTKQFISFVIIGFINTLINFIVLWCSETGLNNIIEAITGKEIVINSIPNYIVRILSVTLAFLIATIFSYFANSRFSFNNKNYSIKKLMETIGVLLIRLIIVIILTECFVIILGYTNLSDIVSNETSDSIANLLASILMIPAAYLVLEKILKVNNEENKDKDETSFD